MVAGLIPLRRIKPIIDIDANKNNRIYLTFIFYAVFLMFGLDTWVLAMLMQKYIDKKSPEGLWVNPS